MADGDLQQGVECPALAAERSGHAEHAALEHIPRVKAVRLLDHAARRKGRLRAGKSQHVIDRQMVFQLLIAVAPHEIELKPRLTIQVLRTRTSATWSSVATAEENVPLCWPG